MEKLGNFNILPKSPPSAYRDPAQGCLHINAGELDLHTSRSESLLPFLRDKCDSCEYYHSHKYSPFVRVQIRGRAFKSRLQPWGKPEGTLANHFSTWFLHTPCQTLTQPHHPKPPFQNARPLFIQGPYLEGWGWRASPQQLFPGEISIPCGLRPKCEEMRNVILSLALIMSLKSAICILNRAIRWWMFNR